MQRDIAQQSRSGSVSIVVAVGTANYDSHEFLQQLTQLGAYMILYQTEPLIVSGTQCVDMIAQVHAANASEVWDYSLANMNVCDGSVAKTFLLRYMPPGYTRYLDYGVDVDSPLQNQSMIGFVGSLARRQSGVAQQYSAVLGKSMVDRNDLWGEKSYKDFFTRYPVQLNIHGRRYGMDPKKPWRPDLETTSPMEAFRMALLLSNKACVLSAPVDPKDAGRWGDIVKFRNLSNTQDVLNVRECRLTAYNTFKERFASGRILKESGFSAHDIQKEMSLASIQSSESSSSSSGQLPGAPVHLHSMVHRNPEQLTTEDRAMTAAALFFVNMTSHFWVLLCTVGIVLIVWFLSKVKLDEKAEDMTFYQALPIAVLWSFLGIALILFNKFMFLPAGYGFGFAHPIFLMWIQALMGTIATNILRFTRPRIMPAVTANQLNMKTYFVNVFPIACLQAAGLAFGNTAYLYISVAYIQMIKNTTSAFVFMFSILLGLERVNFSNTFAVGLVVTGLLLTTVGELNFALIGFLFQMGATLSDSLRLALTKIVLSSRHAVNLDPMSALYYSSPTVLIILSVPMSLCDAQQLTMATVWNMKFALCASGLLAFGLNMTSMFFMKRCGATTFALTGVLKDIALILFCCEAFGHPKTAFQLTGFIVSLLGFQLYNKLKSNQSYLLQVWSSLRGLEYAGPTCENSRPED